MFIQLIQAATTLGGIYMVSNAVSGISGQWSNGMTERARIGAERDMEVTRLREAGRCYRTRVDAQLKAELARLSGQFRAEMAAIRLLEREFDRRHDVQAALADTIRRLNTRIADPRTPHREVLGLAPIIMACHARLAGDAASLTDLVIGESRRIVDSSRRGVAEGRAGFTRLLPDERRG